MENRNKLIIAGLIGILAYFVLPSWSKIFAFLIPTLTLSYVYSNRNLNTTVIIFCSLLYLLFPSSLFTLSTSTSLELQLVRWIESPVTVIMGLVIFVPLIISIVSLIIAVVNLVNPMAWATGKVELDAEKTIKTVLRTIVVVAMILIFALIAGLFGWKIYGIDWLQGVLVKVWDYLVNLPRAITNNDVVKEAIGIGDEMPGFQIALNSLQNPRILGLTVASIYPLLLSIVVVIIGIFYTITRSNPKGEADYQNQFERPLSLNLAFLIFLLIIWIVAFMFYLSYTIESFLNYANIGFFGLYLIITSGCCIFLTLGIGTPTKNSKMTAYGIFLGVMLLFIYQNMFSQARSLNLIGLEYVNITSVQILNNFVFIGPTESLLFHVFGPSLVLFVFLRKNVVYSDEELAEKKADLRNQILIAESTAKIRAELLDKQDVKDKKDYAKNIREVANLRIKLAKLENQTGTPVNNDTKAISNSQFMVYLFSVFGFNILFAILHWFKSGLTFEIFWSSGLGFLYLSSGMIITLVGYKYGWLAAILSHAIHNSLILLLVALMSVI